MRAITRQHGSCSISRSHSQFDEWHASADVYFPASARSGLGSYEKRRFEIERPALALEEAIYGERFQAVPRFGTRNKNAAPN